MKQTIIYALDFDGVICDSAVETGITGWKVATQLWSDMPTPLPPEQLVDQFRRVRPIIETGYESILVMRMLFEGESIEAILSGYSKKKQQTLQQSKRDIDDLKQRFGETRDRWIDNSPDEWIKMNPLFPGVAEKLRMIAEQGVWYIVTTKQERFVTQILDANQVSLSARRIFGLDRKMSKEAVLMDLLNNHPEETIYFVEDRLPTLLNVLKNNQLQAVKLFFADWGYNTEQDRIEAARNAIELIDIGSFPPAGV